MGRLDCVKANIFHHTQKFEMLIGPKLDRVNRPLNDFQGFVNMFPFKVKFAKFYHLLRTHKTNPVRMRESNSSVLRCFISPDPYWLSIPEIVLFFSYC